MLREDERGTAIQKDEHKQLFQILYANSSFKLDEEDKDQAAREAEECNTNGLMALLHNRSGLCNNSFQSDSQASSVAMRLFEPSTCKQAETLQDITLKEGDEEQRDRQ